MGVKEITIAWEDFVKAGVDRINEIHPETKGLKFEWLYRRSYEPDYHMACLVDEPTGITFFTRGDVIPPALAEAKEATDDKA